MKNIIKPLTIELIHIEGPFKGKIEEFQKNEILIGRHPSCDICFPKDLTIISRYHAKITRKGNRFLIIDQSKNGTFLNGKKIKEAYLKNGDVLTFTENGPKVSFLLKKAVKANDLIPQINDKDETLQIPIDNQRPFSENFFEEVLPSEAKSPRIGNLLTPQKSPSAKVQKVNTVFQYGPMIKSFNKVPVTFGTEKNCDFYISGPETSVSKLQVTFEGGDFILEDLYGSSATLNGQPIREPVKLKAHDIIALANGQIVLEYIGQGRFAELLEKSDSRESKYFGNSKEKKFIHDGKINREKNNGFIKKLFKF